ncbi:hypothetical protein B0O99DRAFT_310886 [Bisporella sp. PMI_857]|nr:hypothetical protein B0O99DRAFT_310886 [Bisporella sp. PMI_857]
MRLTRLSFLLPMSAYCPSDVFLQLVEPRGRVFRLVDSSVRDLMSSKRPVLEVIACIEMKRTNEQSNCTFERNGVASSPVQEACRLIMLVKSSIYPLSAWGGGGAWPEYKR